MSFMELGKYERIECVRAYDRYIQQANAEDKYFEGWKPVCLDEFADNEWQEMCASERVYENICCGYYDTKDDECVYDVACSDTVKLVHIACDNEAYVYGTWQELYECVVKYDILDDYRDIGLGDIQDYLDDEAFDFVCVDLGWDYDTTLKQMEEYDEIHCSRCTKKPMCEIDGYACDIMEELNERLGLM